MKFNSKIFFKALYDVTINESLHFIIPFQDTILISIFKNEFQRFAKYFP